MADKVTKKYTVELNLDVKTADAQVKKLATNINNMWADIGKASNKFSVFKDLVDYLGAIDEKISGLKNLDLDLFNKIFGVDGSNIDAALKQAIEPIMKSPEQIADVLTSVKVQMAEIQKAGNVKGATANIKQVGIALNQLYQLAGKAPVIDIEKQLGGSGNFTKKMEILEDKLSVFEVVWDNVVANMNATSPVGIKKFSREVQNELDVLDGKIKSTEQLMNDLKDSLNVAKAFNDFKPIKLKVDTSDQALKNMLDQFKLLSIERQKFLEDGDTSSDAYNMNFAKYIKAATQLIAANEQLASINSVPQFFEDALNVDFPDVEEFVASIDKKMVSGVQAALQKIVDDVNASVNTIKENAAKDVSGNVNEGANQHMNTKAVESGSIANEVKQETKEAVDAIEYAKKELAKAYQDYYNAVQDAKNDGVDVLSGYSSDKMHHIEKKISQMLKDWNVNSKISNPQWELDYIKDSIVDDDIVFDDIGSKVDEIFDKFDITADIPVSYDFTSATNAADSIVSELNTIEAKTADVNAEFQKLIDHASQFGGGPKLFFAALERGAMEVNDELKQTLQALNLIDESGKMAFTTPKSGSTNKGGLLSDEYALIARPISKAGYAEAIQPKLLEAENAGASVGTILGIFKDEVNGLVYELQKKVQGKDLLNQQHQLNNVDFLDATDDQLEKFIKDLMTFQKTGLYVDQNGKNILYDKQNGFSFIDFFSNAVPGITASKENSVQENVKMLLSELHGALSQQDYSAFSQKILTAMDKVIGNTSTTGSAGQLQTAEQQVDDVSVAFEKLVNYISGSGLKPKEFFNNLVSGAQELNGELSNVLKSLGLLDEQGHVNLESLSSGFSNTGGMISDDYVLISRNAEKYEKYSKKIQEKSLLAKDEGANIGAILGLYNGTYNENGQEIKVVYELQNKVKGKETVDYSTGVGVVNPDVLKASSDQLKKLMNDMLILQKHGLWVDYNGSNILYDKDEGFSFVDLIANSTWFTAGADNSLQENVQLFLKQLQADSIFTDKVYNAMNDVLAGNKATQDVSAQQGLTAGLDAQNAYIDENTVAHQHNALAIQQEIMAHEQNVDAISKEDAALQALNKTAQSMSWENFIFDESSLGLIKTAGFKSLAEIEKFWKDSNYAKQIDFHELSENEANEIIASKIPENLRYDWYVNQDFTAKSKLENMILSDDELRNAAVNKMWRTVNKYSNTYSKQKISFQDFIDTEYDVYRGKPFGHTVFADDEQLSFSFDKSTAESFAHSWGGNPEVILHALVKPKDTIGNVGVKHKDDIGLWEDYYASEVETFVPNDSISLDDPKQSFEDYYQSLPKIVQKELDKKLIRAEANRIKELLPQDVINQIDTAMDYDDFDFQDLVSNKFSNGIIPKQVDGFGDLSDTYNAMPELQQKLFAQYAYLKSLADQMQKEQKSIEYKDPSISKYKAGDELKKSDLLSHYMYDQAGVAKHKAQLIGDSKFDLFGNAAQDVDTESQLHQLNAQAMQQEAQAQQVLNDKKIEYLDVQDEIRNVAKATNISELWNVADGLALANNGDYDDYDIQKLFGLVQDIESQYGQDLNLVKDYLKQAFGHIDFDGISTAIPTVKVTPINYDDVEQQLYSSAQSTSGFKYDHMMGLKYALDNIDLSAHKGLLDSNYIDFNTGDSLPVSDVIALISDIETQYGENLDYVKDYLKQVCSYLDIDNIISSQNSNKLLDVVGIKDELYDLIHTASGEEYLKLWDVYEGITHVGDTSSDIFSKHWIDQGEYSDGNNTYQVKELFDIIQNLEEQYGTNLEFVKDYLKQVYNSINLDSISKSIPAVKTVPHVDFNALNAYIADHFKEVPDAFDEHQAYMEVKNNLFDVMQVSKGTDKYAAFNSLYNKLYDVHHGDASDIVQGLYYDDDLEAYSTPQELIGIVKAIEQEYGENLDYVKDYLNNVFSHAAADKQHVEDELDVIIDDFDTDDIVSVIDKKKYVTAGDAKGALFQSIGSTYDQNKQTSLYGISSIIDDLYTNPQSANNYDIQGILATIDDIEQKYGDNLQVVTDFFKQIVNRAKNRDIDELDISFEDIDRADDSKYNKQDYIDAYQYQSDEAKAAIKDLALFAQQYENLKAKINTEPIEFLFGADKATSSEVYEVQQTLEAFKAKQQEIANMPIVDTEDDKKKLLELQAEAVGLQNKLRGAKLEDGATSSDYKSRFGLSSLMDGIRLRKAIEDPEMYSISKTLEDQFYDMQDAVKHLATFDLKYMMDDDASDALNDFLLSLSKRLQDKNITAGLTEQIQDNVAAAQQQLNVEQNITAEKQKQAVLGDTITDHQVDTIKTENVAQEANIMDDLSIKIQEVRQAVEAKTQAFQTEGNVVSQVVQQEIDSLNKLKVLLDEIQNALQVVFTTSGQKIGDISFKQDGVANGETSSVLQNIQRVLGQILVVLEGFTGIKTEGENSIKRTEPTAKTATSETHDAFEQLANKFPSDIATEGTLNEIKNLVSKLASLPEDNQNVKANDYALESTLQGTTALIGQINSKLGTAGAIPNLVSNLGSMVAVLQSIAQGIVPSNNSGGGSGGKATSGNSNNKNALTIGEQAKQAYESLGKEAQDASIQIKKTGDQAITTAQKVGTEMAKVIKTTKDGIATTVLSMSNENKLALEKTKEQFEAFNISMYFGKSPKIGANPEAQDLYTQYLGVYNKLQLEVQKYDQAMAASQDTTAIQDNINALQLELGGLEKQLTVIANKSKSFLDNGTLFAHLDGNGIKNSANSLKQLVVSTESLAVAFRGVHDDGRKVIYDVLDNGIIKSYAVEVDEATGNVRKMELSEYGLVNAMQNVNKAAKQRKELTGIFDQNNDVNKSATVIKNYLQAKNDLDVAVQDAWDKAQQNGGIMAQSDLDEIYVMSQEVMRLGSIIQSEYKKISNIKATGGVFNVLGGNIGDDIETRMRKYIGDTAKLSTQSVVNVQYDSAAKTMTADLVGLSGEIAKVKLQYSELFDGVQITSFKGTQAVDDVEKKMKSLKTSIADAFSSGFIDSSLAKYNKYKQVVADLEYHVQQLQNGNMPFDDAAIHKWNLLRQTVVDTGNELLKIAKVNKADKQKTTSEFVSSKTQTVKNFDAYNQSVKDAAYLTQQLQGELSALESLLQNVSDSADLLIWKDDFSKLKTKISKAKEDFTLKKTGELNSVSDQLNESFKTLNFGTKTQGLNAEQTAIVEKYKSIRDEIKKCSDAIQRGEQVSISSIQANIGALTQEIEAYKKKYNIVNAGGKNKNTYGTSQLQTFKAKYNSLMSGANDVGLSGEAAVVKQLVAAYDELKRAQSAFAVGEDQTTAEYGKKVEVFKAAQLACNQYAKELNNVINASKKLEANSVNSDTIAENFEDTVSGRKEALISFVQSMYGANATIDKFKSNFNELTFEVKNGDGTFTSMTATINAARTAIHATAGDTQQMTSAFSKFTNDLWGKFKSLSTYFIASFGWQDIWYRMKEGVQYVREIDSALTELKKVTNETDATYNAFLQTMSKTAGNVGGTVKDLTTMAADWARLGYTIEEAGMLAENTAILLNVSEFDDATQASEALISTMQAFQYTADESRHVVDILNEVGEFIARR